MKIDASSIDLRRLRYFIAVCNHGGFSHAASIVGVAQPALTRQIKLLESEMGMTLINRNGRGAEPTEEGRILLTRAAHHLSALDGIVAELKLGTGAVQGTVALGICPTIAPFFLDGLRMKLAANNPGVALSVIEAYSGDLRNLMASNRLDLALTYKPSQPTSDTVTELFSERLIVVSGRQPETVRRSFALGELETLRLVLPSRAHELRVIIDAACKKKGILLRPEFELDSLAAVKSLFDNKPAQFFTILPAHGVQADIESQRFSHFELEDQDMCRTIAIVEPERQRNVATTACLKLLIEAQVSAIRARHINIF